MKVFTRLLLDLVIRVLRLNGLIYRMVKVLCLVMVILLVSLWFARGMVTRMLIMVTRGNICWNWMVLRKLTTRRITTVNVRKKTGLSCGFVGVGVDAVISKKVGAAKLLGDPDTMVDGISSSHMLTSATSPIGGSDYETGEIADIANSVRKSNKILVMSIPDG